MKDVLNVTDADVDTSEPEDFFFMYCLESWKDWAETYYTPDDMEAEIRNRQQDEAYLINQSAQYAVKDSIMILNRTVQGYDGIYGISVFFAYRETYGVSCKHSVASSHDASVYPKFSWERTLHDALVRAMEWTDEIEDTAQFVIEHDMPSAPTLASQLTNTTEEYDDIPF